MSPTKFKLDYSAPEGTLHVFRLFLDEWLYENCIGDYTVKVDYEFDKNEIYYSVSYENLEDQLFITLRGFPPELEKYMKPCT